VARGITVNRPDKSIRNWTILHLGRIIGRVIVHADGDWSGRIGTMNEADFNTALELVNNEIAEEELLMHDEEVQ
jgi:hypothetical protein